MIKVCPSYIECLRQIFAGDLGIKMWEVGRPALLARKIDLSMTPQYRHFLIYILSTTLQTLNYNLISKSAHNHNATRNKQPGHL